MCGISVAMADQPEEGHVDEFPSLLSIEYVLCKSPSTQPLGYSSSKVILLELSDGGMD